MRAFPSSIDVELEANHFLPLRSHVTPVAFIRPALPEPLHGLDMRGRGALIGIFGLLSLAAYGCNVPFKAGVNCTHRGLPDSAVVVGWLAALIALFLHLYLVGLWDM